MFLLSSLDLAISRWITYDGHGPSRAVGKGEGEIDPLPQILERIEVKPVTAFPHDFQTFLRTFSGHWLGSPLKIWELSSGSASTYYFQHLE